MSRKHRRLGQLLTDVLQFETMVMNRGDINRFILLNVLGLSKILSHGDIQSEVFWTLI